MKWKVILVSGILLVGFAYVFSKSRDIRSEPLVSAVVEITATPEPTPTASPSAVPQQAVTASPSSRPTTKPSPTPTMKIVPTPTAASSQEVNGFIDRFSGQYGVDPNVLRHMAVCESTFRSNATQGKYVGLFQFDATTWKNIRKEMGEDPDPDLRYSAEESVQTAAYAISKGKTKLWPGCYPK